MTNGTDLERLICAHSPTSDWHSSPGAKHCPACRLVREIIRLREELAAVAETSRAEIALLSQTDELARLRGEVAVLTNMRNCVVGVRRWAATLIAGNIEAQKVVDELDFVLAGKAEEKTT